MTDYNAPNEENGSTARQPNSNPVRSVESPQRPGMPKSPVIPGVPMVPGTPVSPESPVSNEEKVLKAFAARNACTNAQHDPAKRRFNLARDMRAIEKKTGKELEIVHAKIALYEWHRLSLPFLGTAMTCDDHFAAFLTELSKVRVPTGENETLKKALESVAKLSGSELPIFRKMPDAPESWRKVAALHRELSQRSSGNVYFLSSGDAAKAVPGMTPQTAYSINGALRRFRVIKLIRVGDSRPNGKASEFRYLAPEAAKKENMVLEL